MLFIGTIIGAPVVGWLSDRIKRRRIPMMVGAVIALFLILLLMYLPHLSLLALLALLIIFLGLGFITSTQIISYLMIAESNPLALTGTAEGMTSVLIMAVGRRGGTQPLFTRLMEWQWSHQVVNHVPLFLSNDYQFALAIMLLAFIFRISHGVFIQGNLFHLLI